MTDAQEAVKRSAENSDSDEEWIGPKVEESSAPKKRKGKHFMYF